MRVDSADQAAEKLSALLAETSSLQASVLQLETDSSGRLREEKRIELLLRKPAHLSLRQTTPYEQMIVTNGIKWWTYEPDLDEVTIEPFPEDASGNPMLLLSADAETLLAQYDISKSTIGELDRFVLYPIAVDAQFVSVSLTFDQAVMTEMHLEGTYGDKFSLTFSNVKTNIELPDALFELEIPAGAEVLDSTEY